MQFSAVLFDMDGVLVDTDRAIADLWHRLASESGLALSDEDLANHVYGCVPEHTVETLFAPLAPPERDGVLARVRAAEPDLVCEPVPYGAELVRALAAEGVPLALVTGASLTRASRALHALGLTGLFDATVTWGEAPRGKPAPDCYLLAAQRLDLPPDRCLVFEDTSSGVRAATTAGATCIGVGPADPDALRTSGARHAVPGFHAVSLRAASDGAVLTVADTEEFRLRSTSRHRSVAPTTADATEGGSPWR
ncbi:HAD family phosphatase [Streptomyces sp. NPDC020742]|uniref:HAD family hydrolase n=1 Tax=unclassified Streptomyces TaxID=2593676 RepID=UPI0033D0B4D9